MAYQTVLSGTPESPMIGRTQDYKAMVNEQKRIEAQKYNANDSAGTVLNNANNYDYYKGLIESALNGTLASYLASHNQNLKAISGNYDTALNQNSLNWRRAQRSANEALANLGQTNSGIQANRNMAINSKYSNQETNLQAQKAKALAEEEADYQNRVATAKQNSANNLLKYL